jgi:hypothetical protein
MNNSMRRTPWACINSSIRGANCLEVAALNSTPRLDDSSRGPSAASSGRTFIASPMKLSVNWMTRPRSGMLAPSGMSLTQLWGRLGPVSTRLPGSNSPMKSPTK